MVLFSANTGQQALQSLPSKSLSNKRSIENYSIPEVLLHDRGALKTRDEVGLEVLKVTKTGKLQPRRLAISRDRRTILVTTHKVKSIKGLYRLLSGSDATAKMIPLSAIDRIQRGPNTQRFRRAMELHAQSDTADLMGQLIDEERGVCLSIVYRETTMITASLLSSTSGNNNNNNSSYATTVTTTSSSTTASTAMALPSLETLDLVVPALAEYEVLLSALEDLVSLFKEEKQRFIGDVRRLQHLWTELGKGWDATITLSDWISLAERMRIPCPKAKLTSAFRNQSGATNLLTLPQTGLLLQHVRIMINPADNTHPIDALWKQIVQNDPTPHPEGSSISSVAFLSFLRSEQQEHDTKLEEAVDIIHALNQQTTPEDWNPTPTDRLSKTRFVAYLTSDANDMMDPLLAKVGADNMSWPLSYYWINTSHDTYLQRLPEPFGGKYPHSSDPSKYTVDEDAYTTALLRGVRCLELDVWDDPQGTPIVARTAANQNTTPDRAIPLKTVLQCVRHFLTQHPFTFPVILNIENHCSVEGQEELSNCFSSILGRLILKPDRDLSAQTTLPSPESARGKVIIIGKRPKDRTLTIVNDDYDDENDDWEPATEPPDSYQESRRDSGGIVIWFDRHGPIRTRDPHAVARTAAELYEAARREAMEAQRTLEEALAQVNDYNRQAAVLEDQAAQLTIKAGVSPSQVKQRAEQMAGRSVGPNHSMGSFFDSEEKSMKEEGVEVHEVLPEYVATEQQRYTQAVKEATEATDRLAICHEQLQQLEKQYQKAVDELQHAQHEQHEISERARRAAVEARAQNEYATLAQERVKQVRELLLNSQDKSSSAGTVVQTALTEARISEKRASEAEARAKRAAAAAEKDRIRADEETRKEEEMEDLVANMHEDCKKVNHETKQARERVEKAVAMLDRVNDQIKAIENSSQYRREVQNLELKREGSSLRGESAIKQHAAKMEERDRCRALIHTATEEHAAAESRRTVMQSKFETLAHSWRLQADAAQLARRAADRSNHLAEELAEHAEEEREAAALRQIAHQKAEAAVETSGSQRQSVEAQLAEAERASAEALKIATQSKIVAENLAKQVSKGKDHSVQEQLVAEKKWAMLNAKGEYDAAVLLKEEKDRRMSQERRLLDITSELCERAERGAQDVVMVEPLYEKEAISQFTRAVILREEASNATKRAEMLAVEADKKSLIARRAREYKEQQEMSIQIPATLAKQTLLHTSRFKHWRASLVSSNVVVHSFSNNVLEKMVMTAPDDEKQNMLAFTKSHLCRIFPSWRDIHGKSMTNVNSVFPWSLGCQLVAVNFSTCDEHTIITDGRFRRNGSCGYVLKPRSLTHNDTKYVDIEERWSFRILCGFNIPVHGKHDLKVWVKVSLSSGDPGDPRILHTTEAASSYGLDPVWQDNQFDVTVDNPSVALLSFTVWNGTDSSGADFIAGTAVPVNSLRQGYRSLALFDTVHSRVGLHEYCHLLINAKRI